MSPTLFQDLNQRGIIYQTTDPGLEKHLEEKRTLYCGFDPTSDSLHVGSLFPLLTLKRFQDAGHTPVVVLGGATGMIGDPSFKAQERSLLSAEQISKNLEGIRKVASRFLDFDESRPNRAIMINNHDFYAGMNVLQFLRDIGKHFTVNLMMGKDSVRSRMEDRDQGISYTEFSYMLLQAYDYYCLFKQMACSLQIGASDQWGNITAGTELIRRKEAHEKSSAGEAVAQAAYGMTHPLITKSDGGKFGKTESGTIWLSAEKTSPYQFYQFFISAPDDSVLVWLNYLSFLSLEEIAKLKLSQQADPGKKEAQLALARTLTRMVHGEEALLRAENASKALFGSEIKNLDRETLQEIFADTPTTEKSRADFDDGIPLIDLLSETGLFQSKGAARKEITAGGVYLNNERISDPAFVINASHLIAGDGLVLRKGKKNYHLVRLSSV